MAAPMGLRTAGIAKQMCILFIICTLVGPNLHTSVSCSFGKNFDEKKKYFVPNDSCTSTRLASKFDDTDTSSSPKISGSKCSESSGYNKYDESNVNKSLILTFERWRFHKRQLLLETFPLDPIKKNYIRQVKNALFSRVLPLPMVTETHLVAVSKDASTDILDLSEMTWNSELFTAFVSGNTFLPGSEPIAHRYGGHQFGSWSGQLGDGRAVMLGEYVNSKGERWELQLKGSGTTPYSRRGDGRAVLRSSIREFLSSEAMYHLGIPTSRSLSLSVSSDPIWRDQFYDGHPRKEKAAVVLRLAPSWLRIGSLEILAKSQEISLLRKLVDFVIGQYFPQIGCDDPNRYEAFYAEVVSQTAYMIAKWMSVGFAHGVMNTDNFSLLSITIDYGPFGFLDAYIPEFVPNTSDDEAMYSYEKQPDVAHHNLDRLRVALLPLLQEVAPDYRERQSSLKEILLNYPDHYKRHFMDIFRQKLGLEGSQDKDEYLVGLLLKMMQDTEADFTMTFRQMGELAIGKLSRRDDIPTFMWALRDLQQHDRYAEWINAYISRVSDGAVGEATLTDANRQKKMNAVNPRYVLRNWMAQEAITKAESGDYTGVNDLLDILSHPYSRQETAETRKYTQRPPEWAKRLRVSCSS